MILLRQAEQGDNAAGTNRNLFGGDDDDGEEEQQQKTPRGEE